MPRIIDAEAIFIEPLDLWQRYIEPLPHMIELVGDDKFFFSSDYPHAEGFTDPVAKAREALARLPRASLDKVLGDNAAGFFGI
jgi:predicted TIM-barrel fold metal-dependent hydrolase